MMRLDRDHAEVWQALEQLWPQVAPTLALAQALVGTDRKGVTEPELDRALTELASYAAHGARWPTYSVPPPPRRPDGWPTSDEIAHGDDSNRYLWKLVRSVELSLCIVRTAVCQGRAANAKWKRGPHKAALAALVTAHLTHRKADRAERRKQLMRSLSLARVPEAKATVEAELSALDALTDDELLTRRGWR